jgi:hypothetical protein
MATMAVSVGTQLCIAANSYRFLRDNSSAHFCGSWDVSAL